MSEEYGNDFITITDEAGQEFTLEVLDVIDYNGKSYGAYLPADMDENDPDYGMIILEIKADENGEEYFEDVESDEELNDVYEHFMTILFDEEDEDEDEDNDGQKPSEDSKD